MNKGNNSLGFVKELVSKCPRSFFAIFEHHQNSKNNLYVYAIDISKAFDKILHSQEILSLLRSGEDSFICACLWTWYRKVSIRVRVGGHVSKRINIRRGVKQGSVLSPVIFDNAIRLATRHLPPYVDTSFVICG